MIAQCSRETIRRCVRLQKKSLFVVICFWVPSEVYFFLWLSPRPGTCSSTMIVPTGRSLRRSEVARWTAIEVKDRKNPKGRPCPCPCGACNSWSLPSERDKKRQMASPMEKKGLLTALIIVETREGRCDDAACRSNGYTTSRDRLAA